MNYYPFHIGDYARDTAHLSIIEDGAYRRLIDLYYSTEKPLATDRAKLYRLVRAQSKQERAAVDTVLDEFFIATPDGWTHTRCDTEIAKVKEKSDKARKSIESRWKNERNTNVDTNVLRTKNECNTPNSQEPITNNQEKQQGPVDNLSRDVAVAVLLRRLDVDATAMHPAVQAWANNPKVTDTVLTEAVAKARRTKESGAIPPNYLAPIVDEVLNPKPVKQADSWWASQPGIDRKGRELGMMARGGEGYPEYKDRIFAKLKEMKGQTA